MIQSYGARQSDQDIQPPDPEPACDLCAGECVITIHPTGMTEQYKFEIACPRCKGPDGESTGVEPEPDPDPREGLD